MNPEVIIYDVRTYDEKFDIWKKQYFKCCPIIPWEHKNCVERWSAIFHKIPEGSFFKSALFDILSRHLAGAWGVSVYLEKLNEILPALERLISNHSFGDALDFASLFFEINTKTNRAQNDREHFLQTRNARYSRSAKKEPLIKALLNYLNTAFFKWRPLPEEGKPQYQRSKINKTTAAARVFKEHKDEIKEIFESQGCNCSDDSEYSSEFVKLFVFFVDKIKENFELRDKYGYMPEKRASRSQVSKQKSRFAALKNSKQK